MSAPPADPHGFAFRARLPSDPPAALVLLNSTSPGSSLAFLRAVWRSATLRVAADGAANRLYDAVVAGADGAAAAEAGAAPSPAARAALAALLPDAVCGDWDSIAPAPEAFYRASGCAMLAAPDDQDSTDLVKCLREVARRQAAAGGARFRVVVFGAFGGRFDHEAQNLNCLYTWAGAFASLLLLSGDTVASLLPRGASAVRVAAPFEGPTCGLVPLGGACELTTRGLRWDVAAWRSEFGGAISTSNAADGCAEERAAGAVVVRVDASAPVVWTLEVNAAAVVAAAEGAGGE